MFGSGLVQVMLNTTSGVGKKTIGVPGAAGGPVNIEVKGMFGYHNDSNNSDHPII